MQQFVSFELSLIKKSSSCADTLGAVDNAQPNRLALRRDYLIVEIFFVFHSRLHYVKLIRELFFFVQCFSVRSMQIRQIEAKHLCKGASGAFVFRRGPLDVDAA